MIDRLPGGGNGNITARCAALNYPGELSGLRMFFMRRLSSDSFKKIPGNSMRRAFRRPSKQLCCIILAQLFLIQGPEAQIKAKIGHASGAAAPASLVNVFLGSSGDHGQMSPAASAPFGLLSILPQTYPNGHTGYEFKARTVLGFTHNRVEGVGCTGSGGNILITPYSGNMDGSEPLIKTTETASPGSYSIAFTNGISASFVVSENAGVEEYSFPPGKAHGFTIDLSHTLSNRFVAEEHLIKDNDISGWIESKTTCNAGTYRIYYYMLFDGKAPELVEGRDHRVIVRLAGTGSPSQSTSSTNALLNSTIRIAFSSVDVQHAMGNVFSGSPLQLTNQSKAVWNRELAKIEVKGNAETERLFYSLLYRTIQSPFLVSEKDGSYRAIDGSLQHSDSPRYNGWAIWDNYRTQLPLLALMDPARYQDIINSLADLYRYGKKDYATQHEPSNTVRTEHAIVVLLDAYRKGFKVDFQSIKDSLIAEAGRLDFTHPDKALESSYDTWALSQVMEILGDNDAAVKYRAKSAQWRQYWDKDFKDLTQADIDKVGARGMYQGTVWQYRWLVPFDMKGLVKQAGGEAAYLEQLDQFFNDDYYNHANETDIQAPLMYNFTGTPWRSQDLIRKYAADTVVQYYFNDNSRGIDPFVDRIYQNKPDTYVRTMDDDAGAMSAWYVFAACGLMPACVGWPVYYLHVPLLEEVRIGTSTSPFIIRTKNSKPTNRYISSITLNGKPYLKNWISHEDIMKGGTMVIVTSDRPNKGWGTTDQWVSHLD